MVNILKKIHTKNQKPKQQQQQQQKKKKNNNNTNLQN